MSWLKNKKLRDNCWHHRQVIDVHAPETGDYLGTVEAESFIKSVLVEFGSRKMFWCVKCGKTWLN